MLRYIKRQYLLVLTALGISIVSSIIGPVSALLEKNIIDAIVQGNMKDFQAALWYTALVVLAAGGIYYANALTESRFKNRFMMDMRNDLYDGIMRKGIAAFQEQDTADYISMINNDADTVSTNFSNPVWRLISIGITAVLSLAVMLMYSPFLTGTAVLCSLFSFLVPKIITKYIRKSLTEKAICESALAVQLKESLNGHDVVSAYGILPRIRVRFLEANKKLADTLYRFSLFLSLLQNSSSIIGKAVKVVTFLVAGGMAVRGQISVGTVLLFESLYGFFSGGIMTFSLCVPLLAGCGPVIDRLMNVIDGRDDTLQGSTAPTFSTEIRIKDLYFRYVEAFPVLTGMKLSGVDKFLPHITDGVDGQCGEDGANLSGGQKQRIALARALIRGIDFLILDEGVSAIDARTANEIEQELLDMENLTLLTITHRIRDGLLERYDRVLYMDEGRIVERISS